MTETTTAPESFTAHLKVLQHHIERGTCTDSYRCAVALALVEAFPQATHVSVGSHFVVLFTDGGRYQADAPLGMREFIDMFDAKLPVEPAEFDLTFTRKTPW